MASAGQGVLRFASQALRGFEKDERTGKTLPTKDAELELEARRRRLRVGQLTWRERNRGVASRGTDDAPGGSEQETGSSSTDGGSMMRYTYSPSTETAVPNALSVGSGAFTVTKYRWVMAIWQRLVRLALSGLPLQRLLVFMHSEKKAIAKLQKKYLSEKRDGEASEALEATAETIRFAQGRLQRCSRRAPRPGDEERSAPRHGQTHQSTAGEGPAESRVRVLRYGHAVPNLADHQRETATG